MAKKIIYYLIMAVFSSLSMFNEFNNKLFYISLPLFLIAHIFYFKIYSKVTQIKISNALLYSLIFGLVLLLLSTNINFAVETSNRYRDYFLLASLIISFISGLAYFFLSLKDKESRNNSKGKIFLQTVLFYVFNYFMIFIIGLILAGAQAIGGG